MRYQAPPPGPPQQRPVPPPAPPPAGPVPPRGTLPPPGPPPRPEPAHRRKFWEAAWWAGAFIWAGIVLLVDNMGALPEIEGASTWSWILTGAGLYALVLNLWRLMSAREPSPDGGDLFWTGVLLVLGLAGLVGFDIAFPAILIVLGAVLLMRASVARRHASV